MNLTEQNHLSFELAIFEAEAKKWELLQRKATAFSKSSLVPKEFLNNVPNCIIAMNMAQRMNANELMVMQNLYIVHGRPTWSSQWIIAMINGCGRFSPLKFEITDLGEITWNNKKIKNLQCIAWATEKETGERIDSAPVSIEMAIAEGWYGKNGSKWQTMSEVMLRYRSASFFGKIYTPEMLMGLMTVEESQDVATDLSSKYPDSIPVTQPDNTVVTDLADESEPVPDLKDSEDFEVNPEALDKADTLL